MNPFTDKIAQLREARRKSADSFVAMLRKVFLVRAAQARTLKNPAHRVLHAIGVNYGVDANWPRAKGRDGRAKKRRISRFARRLNLRRGA
jgi:hypothetical protein